MDELEQLRRRVEQLEALEQIRQLPAKYALSVDMRNFDAIANLFVEDVTVSRSKQGRQAMKEWYSGALRGPLLGSAHCVSGHIIDLEGPDLATGLVYSRNDLETATTWMTEILAYLDRYERRDGIWYFQRRTPLYWYQCDITNPPLGGGERKLRWEGQEWTAGSFHDAFPTWAEFWAGADSGQGPVKPPAPLNRFLETFRGTVDPPRVNAHPNKT